MGLCSYNSDGKGDVVFISLNHIQYGNRFASHTYWWPRACLHGLASSKLLTNIGLNTPPQCDGGGGRRAQPRITRGMAWL
jgi:hypothetical protein